MSILLTVASFAGVLWCSLAAVQSYDINDIFIWVGGIVVFTLLGIGFVLS